jgi:histidine triad (HIT) family protein
MVESCIFCKIVREEAPSCRVYEDENIVAFMSIQPINVGHTLVVPKKHYENIFEIPEEEIGILFKTVKRITPAVKQAFSADGIQIVQNNGAAAGQVVFHLHVHIIPMSKNRRWVHHAEARHVDLLKNDAKKVRQLIG